MERFAVGSRFENDDGSRGYIRYIGPIARQVTKESGEQVWEDSKDTWIGVEWDEVGRGRHDGEVYGRRYFTTSPNAASFLRPEKLRTGVSFLQALTERYQVSSSSSSQSQASGKPPVEEEMALRTNKDSLVRVEFVGKEKIAAQQSQLDALREATLSSAAINSGDQGNVIAETCPNIVSLDLASNLFDDWSQITAIASQLQQLQVLQLSRHYFKRLESPLANPSAFQSLRVLVLNGCGITSWTRDVAPLLSSLPALEELHLSQNKLSSFDDMAASAIAEQLPHLKVLNLEENDFSLWSEVDRVSALPKLERLILNKNRISEIPRSASSKWPALRSLSLGDNLIASFASVDNMETLFPLLEELRFSGNPVLQGMYSNMGRFAIMARLSRLRLLNQSEIRPKERDEAEKYYVKRMASEDLTKAMQSASASGAEMTEVAPGIKLPTAFIQEHPRFVELARKFGELKDSASRASEAKAAGPSTEVVSVSLRSNAAASMTTKPAVRKLPTSMTVQKLKVMCQMLFKLEPSLQRLYTKDDSAFPELLDDDQRDLGFYGIQNGSEIIMEEVDLEQEKREQERKEKEKQELLTKQMREVDSSLNRQRQQIQEEKASAAASSKN